MQPARREATTPKRATNVSLRDPLIAEAKALGINLSQAAESGIVQAIKDKRAAKAEKQRYEKMAEKMHAKRIERLKRREKRNKLLKS